MKFVDGDARQAQVVRGGLGEVFLKCLEFGPQHCGVDAVLGVPELGVQRAALLQQRPRGVAHQIVAQAVPGLAGGGRGEGGEALAVGLQLARLRVEVNLQGLQVLAPRLQHEVVDEVCQEAVDFPLDALELSLGDADTAAQDVAGADRPLDFVLDLAGDIFAGEGI